MFPHICSTELETLVSASRFFSQAEEWLVLRERIKYLLIPAPYQYTSNTFTAERSQKLYTLGDIAVSY